MGGSGADGPPVGAGECGGGSDEQGAGPRWDVQQGAAQRDLLMAWSLLLGAFNLNFDHCRDLFFGYRQ